MSSGTTSALGGLGGGIGGGLLGSAAGAPGVGLGASLGSNFLSSLLGGGGAAPPSQLPQATVHAAPGQPITPVTAQSINSPAPYSAGGSSGGGSPLNPSLTQGLLSGGGAGQLSPQLLALIQRLAGGSTSGLV